MGEPLRQAQDDLGSEDVPLAAGLGLHDAPKFSLLALRHFNRYRCWHDRHPTKKHATIQSLLWDTTLDFLVNSLGLIEFRLDRERATAEARKWLFKQIEYWTEFVWVQFDSVCEVLNEGIVTENEWLIVPINYKD